MLVRINDELVLNDAHIEMAEFARQDVGGVDTPTWMIWFAGMGSPSEPHLTLYGKDADAFGSFLGKHAVDCKPRRKAIHSIL